MQLEEPEGRERIRLATVEEYASTFISYVDNLGLDPINELEGTRILDVGGADNSFALGLEASDVHADVINADFSAHEYNQLSPLSVTADSQRLPFADNAFDLVISHKAVDRKSTRLNSSH